jgi:predicted ester cyclase
VSSVPEVNKAIVQRFNKEFIELRNVAVFDELVSPDFRNHDAGGEISGRDAARALFTQVFLPAFPDVVVVIHDQFADGDAVITRKSYQGTHKGEFLGIPGTNRAVRISVIEIVKLRDGKYVEHWATADLFGALQQLKGP